MKWRKWCARKVVDMGINRIGRIVPSGDHRECRLTAQMHRSGGQDRVQIHKQSPQNNLGFSLQSDLVILWRLTQDLQLPWVNRTVWSPIRVLAQQDTGASQRSPTVSDRQYGPPRSKNNSPSTDFLVPRRLSFRR